MARSLKRAWAVSARPADVLAPHSELPGHTSALKTTSTQEASPPPFQTLRLAGYVVIGLWLVGLVVFSTFVYRSFFLSEDFGTYNQAWTLIGQGHLNPRDTIYGMPFIKADFELIMWPLALVHLVFPQPVALLYIQDLAVAGCGLVAYWWVLEYLERQRLTHNAVVAVATTALLVTVADPGTYATVGFDFHTEPISTLFILLAGRDFWRGRFRWAWCWTAAALLCGSFAAIMVVGLGVSALLAGSSTRRSGFLLLGAGVAWTALIGLLHANAGSGLSGYAYLAGRTRLSGTGAFLVAQGILLHPSRAISAVSRHLTYMWDHIRGVGTVGLVSAWGVGVPGVVMLVDALSSHPNFSHSSFQNFAVFPFVLVGTVMVLVWLGKHARWASAAVVIGALVAGEAVALGVQQDPASIRSTLAEVPAATASTLNGVLSMTPSGAEVISTIGVMGRFSARQYCYFMAPSRRVPVQSGTVEFVFSTSNLELMSRAQLRAAEAYVRDDLHPEVLVDKDGVAVFLWHPPAGTSSVKVSAQRSPSP